MNVYKCLKHRNNNYLWDKQGMMECYQNEIKPWEMPRAKHATISVLTHSMSTLYTVDARKRPVFKLFTPKKPIKYNKKGL